MTIAEYVIQQLSQTYFGTFESTSLGPDRFAITIVGSNKQYFSVEVFIRDNTRLIIKVLPEKFGVALVEEMSNATEAQKQAFCSIWQNFSYNKLELKVDGNVITPQKFVVLNPHWKEFSIRFSISPFYNPDTQSPHEVVTKYVKDIYALVFSLLSFHIEGFSEGTEKIATTTKHERNRFNRQICLAAKGYRCSVCQVLLSDIYGEIASNYIEVHHSNPVAGMVKDYIVKPLEELYPVCPNCHAMLHRKNPPYSIDELQSIIQNNLGDVSCSQAAETLAEYKKSSKD